MWWLAWYHVSQRNALSSLLPNTCILNINEKSPPLYQGENAHHIQSFILGLIGTYGPYVIHVFDYHVALVSTFHTYCFYEHFYILPVLTLSQTTHFLLLQTERNGWQQFQIWWTWKKVLRNGYKTLWEMEKLLVTSNFSFSRNVFERLVLQTLKNQGLFWKMLMTSSFN